MSLTKRTVFSDEFSYEVSDETTYRYYPRRSYSVLRVPTFSYYRPRPRSVSRSTTTIQDNGVEYKIEQNDEVETKVVKFEAADDRCSRRCNNDSSSNDGSKVTSSYSYKDQSDDNKYEYSESYEYEAKKASPLRSKSLSSFKFEEKEVDNLRSNENSVSYSYSNDNNTTTTTTTTVVKQEDPVVVVKQTPVYLPLARTTVRVPFAVHSRDFYHGELRNFLVNHEGIRWYGAPSYVCPRLRLWP